MNWYWKCKSTEFLWNNLAWSLLITLPGRYYDFGDLCLKKRWFRLMLYQRNTPFIKNQNVCGKRFFDFQKKLFPQISLKLFKRYSCVLFQRKIKQTSVGNKLLVYQ